MVTVSPHHPPIPSGDEHTSLAGLAREIDGLRRRLDPLDTVPERMDELATLLTDLALKVAALSARKGPTPCPSWLLAPADVDLVMDHLDGVCGWLEAVYLRYADAAASLPECWLWHPDVVEELLWLMHAWLAAYQGPAASVGLVADWHDRHRPGVVRRLKQAAGSCSRERHQNRPGWDPPASRLVAPAADMVGVIAGWWAHHRDQPAPEPAHRTVPAGARVNGQAVV